MDVKLRGGIQKGAPIDEAEMFKQIPYAPGYVVSNKGRILREIRWKHQNYKYKHQIRPSVTLRINNKSVGARVHRLVIEAFGPPRPFPEAVVRHGDGDSENNDIDNLLWGTHKENSEDALRHGTLVFGERQQAAILTDAKVAELRILRRTGWLYRDLATKFGISRQQASEVARGLHWKHVP